MRDDGRTRGLGRDVNFCRPHYRTEPPKLLYFQINYCTTTGKMKCSVSNITFNFIHCFTRSFLAECFMIFFSQINDNVYDLKEYVGTQKTQVRNVHKSIVE